MPTTSKLAFQAIEEIASTPGKNDKTALLKAFVEDGGEFFEKVLKYAYDPFLTYGTRLADCDWRDGHSGGPGMFDDGTWGLLDDLAARRLTGHNARDAIFGEFFRLDVESAQLLSRIILKDLRAGFSESTINKVKKGLIPTFPYMRCSLPKDTDFSKWNWANGVFSQEKADGMFVNANLDVAGPYLTSRQGTPLPHEGFSDLIAELEDRFEPGFQLHGEILVAKANPKVASAYTVLPREIGNGMLNKVIQGGAFEEGCKPILKVWDMIPIECVKTKGQCSTPYASRLQAIHSALRATPGDLVSIIETRIVRSLKEAYAHCRELMLQGKEGTILKKLAMIWKDGTSKDQIKLKLEAVCELEVVGFEEGYGKNAATFGSLACQSSCGKLRVNVGTGLKDVDRLIDRDTWMGKIISVKANGIMYSDDLAKKAHSLFLPVYLDTRLDKNEADTFERIEWQFENAIDNVGEPA